MAHLQELFDFQRVSALAPGVTVTVYLTIPPEVAADVGSDGELRIVPGTARVWVGEPGHAVEGILLVEHADDAPEPVVLRRPWAAHAVA